MQPLSWGACLISKGDTVLFPSQPQPLCSRLHTTLDADHDHDHDRDPDLDPLPSDGDSMPQTMKGLTPDTGQSSIRLAKALALACQEIRNDGIRVFIPNTQPIQTQPHTANSSTLARPCPSPAHQPISPSSSDLGSRQKLLCSHKTIMSLVQNQTRAELVAQSSTTRKPDPSCELALCTF